MSGTAASRNSGARGWLKWCDELARSPHVWMILLGFWLRFWWVLLVPSRPVGDFAMYRESAAFLLDQGHFDPEFIYMPGYVFLLAGVEALGGGLLAAKLIGVVAGTVVVFSIGGIADSLFGRRAGIVAAALAALWPAGIAATSVTGTDVPAAALVALGVFLLVRIAPRRPWLAAGLMGLVLGLAAWVRAVAIPLAAVSVLYWLATAVRPAAAVSRTAFSVVIAFVVLLPWGIRNHRVYGELFLTDSHGGNTALVGANPNSEGTYSRSLNLMFVKGTGYQALESTPRHRDSDRAAYAVSRGWTRFEPWYAMGLLAAKADRLLGHERNLLYWPVFRQGVLDDSQRQFFDAHRSAIERLVDGFWWTLCAFFAVGVGICTLRRQWTPLVVLGFPLALAAIYTLFFSEVRYHLAIAPLMFPHAAFAFGWALEQGRRRFAGQRRTLVVGALSIMGLFCAWWVVGGIGRSLRASHRWAVTVCSYPDAEQKHLCTWERVLPRQGDSPVRGVWDGVGLQLSGAATHDVMASARTVIPIAAGRLRVRAALSLTGRSLPDGAVAVVLRARGRVIARAVSAPVLPRQGPLSPTAASPAPYPGPTGPRAGEINVPMTGIVEHTGGPLVVEVEVEPGGIGSTVDGATVWISNLVVERF